jgi:hypothetical protein
MSGVAGGRHIQVQPRRSYRKPQFNLATTRSDAASATIRR